MKIRQQLVTKNKQTYGGVNPLLGVVVHETGNTSRGANAAAHANLQTNGNSRDASWHISVDEKEAVQSYADTEQCWHAGGREANRTRLAVEICVNEDGDYDAAFRNAAEVVRMKRIEHGWPRANVEQHFDHSGKDCPSRIRAEGRWEEFLDLTEPGGGNNMSQMVSPFEGRLTQNHWRSGGYKGHKGMDIAPPKPGQTGLPVRAAFAGTVRRTHRSARPGNRASTWAPGRTGNGVLISNPDGEGNGYNHMRPLDHWKVGDKVAVGDLLGYNDRSGNQTGPHLHFEMLKDWRNPDSDYDPALAFKKFGVTPGSCPVVTKPAGSVNKPANKPSKPKPAKDSNSKDDYVAIAKALNKMGLKAGYPDGVNGPMLKAAVRAYQLAHGLVVDGVWGPTTQAKFVEVKAVQNALRREGYTKQGVDGYYGNQTKANVKDYQRRVGLVQDGNAGPITRKKLGVK
ncbi:peptidoglycan-binding protein [Glutamicibacter creatinolyticus]|uniref:peptidoglycan-binding protein n=1 Tax=Glutamicibacter creatinolyticus TaxID=162496 RepID=UPI003216F3E0